MSNGPKFDILDLFLENKIIKPDIAEMARNYAKKWRMSGFHAVLATHIMSESGLADTLGKLLKVDRVWQVKTLDFDYNALKILSFKQSREWELLIAGPSHSHANKIEVVMADPTRIDYVEYIEKQLQAELTLAVSERKDIVSAIDQIYPLEDQLPGLYRPMDV